VIRRARFSNDYCPIVLHTDAWKEERRKYDDGPFKFEAFSLSNKDSEGVHYRAWEEPQLLIVQEQIANCGVGLKERSAKTF